MEKSRRRDSRVWLGLAEDAKDDLSTQRCGTIALHSKYKILIHLSVGQARSAMPNQADPTVVVPLAVDKLKCAAVVLKDLLQ